MTSAPPDGFELALHGGEPAPAMPEPTPIDYVELPAAHVGGPSGRVVVSYLAERSSEIAIASALARDRLTEALRYRAGLSYSVEQWFEPLTAHLGHHVLWADCRDDDADSVQRVLIGILDDLAEHGPTEQELERHRDEARARATDHAYLASLLHYHAARELEGATFESTSELLAAELAATADGVRAAFAAAVEQPLLIAPQGSSIVSDRFRRYPMDSPSR